MHAMSGWENLRERDNWEGMGVDGKIISEGLQEISWNGAEWTTLAQDRDWWQALVNTAMNILVPQNAGNFLTS